MNRTAAALLLLLSGPAWAVDARVAVAEFDNAADSADYDALGKGLQAMVTTDLSQVAGLTLVERERLTAITDEIALATSGLVDPATAARLGKLLGATHFIAGTFTVVGDGMRLDARLVSIESGTVVVAAQAEGQKDAFFELEKALVADLLTALGAVPTPKERAAISRIHTADFDALERYGEGIALYDAERYDEAVATLRDVLAKDAEFVLARRTLEEYEALIEQIRAKARAIELTEAEQEFVEARAQAGREGAAATWLQEKASDETAPWEDRVTALAVLTVALRPFGFTNGGFRELRDVEDQYALFRAADLAYARLYTEVRPKWPEVTPFLVTSTSFDASKDFAEELADARDDLLGDRQMHDMRSCRGLDELTDLAGTMLLLDTRERAAELDRLTTEGKACLGDRDWADARYDLAALYGQVLDMERSTAVLEALASSTTDTSLLSRIEHAVGENREVAKVLAESGPPTYREFLLFEQHGKSFSSYFSRFELADAKAGNPRAMWQLTRRRVIGTGLFGDPLWVAETLAFVLPRPATFGTGPRPDDPMRTTSLRYYGDDVPHDETSYWMNSETGERGTTTRSVAAPPPEPAIVLFGHGPRADFTLSMALTSTAPDDFWPIGHPPPRTEEEAAGEVATRVLSPGRPPVGILFGVRDVDVDAVCDPDGTGMESVPMQAWGILVDGDTVRLARVHEVDPDWSDKGCSLFTDFVDAWAAEDVATATVNGAENARKITVKVKGTAVEVKVDGATRAFTLPEPAKGFPGLLLHGIGYVEVSDIHLE